MTTKTTDIETAHELAATRAKIVARFQAGEIDHLMLDAGLRSNDRQVRGLSKKAREYFNTIIAL
jgi:hypothetical protein